MRDIRIPYNWRIHRFYLHSLCYRLCTGVTVETMSTPVAVNIANDTQFPRNRSDSAPGSAVLNKCLPGFGKPRDANLHQMPAKTGMKSLIDKITKLVLRADINF